MRISPVVLSTVMIMGVVACNTSTSGPARQTVMAVPDGFVHYATGGNVLCTARPIVLEGSHTRVEANGGCRAVRVTGEHNDVIVEMAPGGSIDVTGAHNDIWWRPAGPGPAPSFRDTGVSNTLHRDDG